MSGGDPTAFHAGHSAAPLALRAVSQITPISAAEAFRSHGAEGGGAYLPGPAAHPMVAAFWRRIATDADRLSADEDALVWAMRGAGHGWPAITAAILDGRQDEERQRQARSLDLAVARTGATGVRKCLRCEKPFASASVGHRRCEDCRRALQSQGLL